MNSKFLAIKKYASAHKFISGVVILVMLYGGYKGYKTLTAVPAVPHYVIGQTTIQTIISSVSGSGQVGTVNQLDLKPKASGDIIYLGVSSNGQDVKAGTLIAQLDTTDAQKAVRDAETNLETAKLSMEKLMQPPDDLQLTQSENS